MRQFRCRPNDHGAFALAVVGLLLGGACDGQPASKVTSGTGGTTTASGGSVGPTGPAAAGGIAGGSAGGADGGASASGGAAGSLGSCPVSNRPTSTACPQSVASIMRACQTDTDCMAPMFGVIDPASGHCIPFGGQMLCSYDTCQTDDDCGARPAVCLCQGQWHGWSGWSPGNACGTAGNCRSDSDCPGSTCSPSVGFGATFYGYVGYYCHSSQDQCRCDADCTGQESCAYSPELGAWACARFGPAG